MGKKEKQIKKRGNFLARNYLESWRYLKKTKNFIWAVVILFLIFALIGFFIHPPAELEKIILSYIMQILEKTRGMSLFELISFIFFNNMQTGFFGIILGFLVGLFPVILTLVNGYVLGYVSFLAVSSGGASSLLNLLPHGIFELPAIFISLGLGLKFGTFIFEKNKGAFFKEFFINSLKVFVFIIIPLLIIAAIIEGSLIFILS